MSKYQSYKIDPKQFLTIATNVLFRTVLEAPRTQAKNLFQAISADKRVSILDVRMEEDADVRFDLALDFSEYRGEKLNFSHFRDSVTALVGALSETLRAEKDIPVYTEQDQGAMMFGIPGVTEVKGEVNVLMLGIDLRGAGSVLLNLQYLDPSQFNIEDDAAPDPAA